MLKGFGRWPFAGARAGRGAGVRKPRKEETAGRRGAVWLGATYGDLKVADGSAMWRRGRKAAGVIVGSEHDGLFRGRGCERRVWERHLDDPAILDASAERNSASPTAADRPMTLRPVVVYYRVSSQQQKRSGLERVMVLERGFAWNGETYGRHCHVAKGRTRHFTTSRDVRPLRPRSATWSSPQREARGAFGLRGDGVGR